MTPSHGPVTLQHRSRTLPTDLPGQRPAWIKRSQSTWWAICDYRNYGEDIKAQESPAWHTLGDIMTIYQLCSTCKGVCYTFGPASLLHCLNGDVHIGAPIGLCSLRTHRTT
eukprot:1117640-Pelagomonas_calceolata.AAC.10